jgi:hypothetical protein
MLTVQEGEYVMLEVRNDSERRDAYITVLNLTPGRAITCAFPDPGEVPKFESKPGKWIALKNYVFRATLPSASGADQDNNKPAVDMYKAIGTTEQADFSALLFQPPDEGGKKAVQRGVGLLLGGKNHGVARLIGLAMLGQDPDPLDNDAQRPPKMRGDRVQVEITDWSTADFIIEVKRRR